MKKVIILGGGLAGLSAVAHLRKRYDVLLLEKEAIPGGILKTTNINGYIFDHTGHLIHSLNNEMKSFIKAMKLSLIEVKRSSAVYIENKYIPYPIQLNFKYLNEKQKIINDILKSQQEIVISTDTNFYKWVENYFGKTLSDLFFIPYNEKLLRIDLSNVSSDWFSRYLPIPDKIEMIRSLKNGINDAGYNATFCYPQSGGIQVITDKMSELFKKNIKTNINIEGIDIENRIIKTRAEKYNYDILISTIPYPEFLKLSKIEANYKIDYVNVYDLNVGVKKANFPYHWAYFSGKDLPFYRIGSYSNISNALVPKERESFYIEVSFTDKRPNKEEILKMVEQVGIFKIEDIEVAEEKIINYAYPIYNLDIKRLRNHQRRFQENGVFFFGRSGSWKYLSMADIFKESYEAFAKF